MSAVRTTTTKVKHSPQKGDGEDEQQREGFHQRSTYSNESINRATEVPFVSPSLSSLSSQPAERTTRAIDDMPSRTISKNFDVSRFIACHKTKKENIRNWYEADEKYSTRSISATNDRSWSVTLATLRREWAKERLENEAKLEEEKKGS